MDMVKLTGAIEVESVLDFTLYARVNEHARLHFRGILNIEYAKQPILRNLHGKTMRLACDGKPYFTGNLLRPKIKNEGGYYSVEAECISRSAEFDDKENSRSFQDTAMTYEEMLITVAKKRGSGNILPIAGRDVKIDSPIIQYQETDWAFTKRMASHFGTVVIPEIQYDLPQIAMGVIRGKEYTIEDHNEYEIISDIAACRYKEKKNTCKLIDFNSYRVRDYRNFNLGDKVKFLGYTLTVMAKKLYLKDGLLEGLYELGYEQGYGMSKQYNTPICGQSIPGTVLATAGEQLKIHLDIDETQDKEKAFWYTWMPQTGNLMYCMPKLGTKVRLHFPQRDETKAIAAECVRTNGGIPRHGDKLYEIRRLATEHEKSVTLSPNAISFAGNSAKNISTLDITDGRGIQLQSSGHISIYGMGRLSMMADGMVEIIAGQQLKIGKTGTNSGLELSGGEINKYAEKIYHNGLPGNAPIETAESVGDAFPAGLFVETALAMIPVSTEGGTDPGVMSALAMTNIGICKFE